MEAITIIAQSLASQDFKRCYGIVGVPVIELSMAMQ
jgi:thiamine pyrophosphate-dependent acetolactate synthase large subunit-like protein